MFLVVALFLLKTFSKGGYLVLEKKASALKFKTTENLCAIKKNSKNVRASVLQSPKR